VARRISDRVGWANCPRVVLVPEATVLFWALAGGVGLWLRAKTKLRFEDKGITKRSFATREGERMKGEE